jgi:hypothetical protein
VTQTDGAQSTPRQQAVHHFASSTERDQLPTGAADSSGGGQFDEHESENACSGWLASLRLACVATRRERQLRVLWVEPSCPPPALPPAQLSRFVLACDVISSMSWYL